jgi:uncharacterized protein (DUF305 family)
MSTELSDRSETELPPPPPDDPAGPDDDGGAGGWWSASPTWAKAVVAGGLALVLLMVGGLVGGLVGRDTATTYGPPDGSVDVAFLQDMSTHHRQAVQMAVFERSNTADPQLRQLAFDIESSQTAQVGSMEGWLRLWDEPTAPPDGTFMRWMGMPTTAMPGMATEDELTQFRSLSGPALDVRFLQLMLRHHEGGFPMLAAGQQELRVPAARTLAASMLRSQTAEADTMRQMLAARGAAPLPSPSHGPMPGMADMPGMAHN